MPHNPGPLLTGDRLGGENTIPPEFIAAMERHVDVQWNPTTTEPDPLSDTVVESEIATDRINERRRQTVKKKAGNITLSGIRHNESGQPVQVTLLMRPTTDTAGVPSATQQVAVKDLGNGWSIEETSVAGSYIGGVFTAGVFGANLYGRERPNLVPEKFRPSVPTVTTRVDSAGTAVDPALSSDELRETQEQVTAFKKRITIDTQASPSLPVTLTGYTTTNARQLATVVETLETTATAPSAPTALQEVKVEPLGDGKFIRTTSTVGDLFPQTSAGQRQAIVLPDKFKQIGATLVTSGVTSVGTSATLTALGSGGTGVVESRAERVDATKVRVENTTLTASTNASVTEYALRDGQLVTVATSYVADSEGAPTVSSTTEIVEREVIGGGKAIQRVGNVGAVFPRTVAAKQQAVNYPDKFKGADAIVTTTGSTTTGTTATATTLGTGGTGVIESVAQRVDATKVRVEDKTLSGTLNSSVTEYGFYEGLVASITTGYVADSTLASAGGHLVTDVQREVIGGGKAINKVESVASFPTRYGQDYNARFNVVIPWTETTIAPTASGTANTEIRPVDFARQRNRTYDFANITAAYTASNISFPGKFTVDLPNVLKTVRVTYNKSEGSGASNHPTSQQYVTFTAKGSGSLAPTSTAQSSAAIIADVTYEIEYYQGISVDCTHYYFYLTSTATLAQILTKTGAISLPKFRPQSVQLTAYGGQVSLQQSADSRISASSDSFSRISGDGYSTEVGVSSKVITIPPTIHGSITVQGQTTQTAAAYVSASADITQLVYAPKKGSTNGAPDFTIAPTKVGLVNTPTPRYAQVKAGVEPTSFGATSPAAIPTSGKYLVACSGEPVDYGFTLIHAVVVDFAQYG